MRTLGGTVSGSTGPSMDPMSNDSPDSGSEPRRREGWPRWSIWVLVGLVVAFISAVIAIRWMVTWLEQRGFAVFGWYRLGIGAATLVAVAGGAL